LELALDNLFGGDSGAAVSDGGTGTGQGSSNGAQAGVDSGNADLDAALERARIAIQDKAAALRAGDWNAYGEADDRLTLAIEQAIAALDN